VKRGGAARRGPVADTFSFRADPKLWSLPFNRKGRTPSQRRPNIDAQEVFTGSGVQSWACRSGDAAAGLSGPTIVRSTKAEPHISDNRPANWIRRPCGGEWTGRGPPVLDAIDQDAVSAYQPYWAVRAHLLQLLGKAPKPSRLMTERSAWLKNPQ